MIWYPPPPSSHFPKLLILESLIGALYSGVDTFKVSSSWINFDSTACECLSRVTPLYNLVQWDDFTPSMPWRSASVKRDFWSVQLFNPFFRQMILRYDIFCRKITSRYFLPEGKRVNGNNFYCYKNLTHQKFSVTTTYTFSSRKKGETASLVSLLYYCKCWNTYILVITAQNTAHIYRRIFWKCHSWVTKFPLLVLTSFLRAIHIQAFIFPR